MIGGVPGQGVVVEGVKGVKYTPMPLECMKTVKETGGLAHFFAFNSPKIPFFAQKYLTRYTSKTFLRNKIFSKYLRHCGVILYLFKVSEVIYAPRRPD